MNTKYKVIFIVLTYRNIQDLKDFFSHNHVPNSHTVVVNSYYDDETEQQLRIIAQENGASFLSVPNKGYGAGNNRGIEYAMNHFEFDYLVISNADIIIEKMSVNVLDKYANSIIAPKILNLRGKSQNPSVPFMPSETMEKFRYWIYSGNHKKVIWLYFLLSRFKKVIYYAISKYRRRIFSAHGAFVIIPESVLKVLHPLYNEKMFLFNEEEYLGRLAISKKIETYYVPEILIRHKEDGSIKLDNTSEFDRLKQSYMVYYNYWIKNER